MTDRIREGINWGARDEIDKLMGDLDAIEPTLIDLCSRAFRLLAESERAATVLWKDREFDSDEEEQYWTASGYYPLVDKLLALRVHVEAAQHECSMVEPEWSQRLKAEYGLPQDETAHIGFLLARHPDLRRKVSRK